MNFFFSKLLFTFFCLIFSQSKCNLAILTLTKNDLPHYFISSEPGYVELYYTCPAPSCIYYFTTPEQKISTNEKVEFIK